MAGKVPRDLHPAETQICPWGEVMSYQCEFETGGTPQHADHVRWHCLILEEAGIIQQIRGGRWVMTEKGKALTQGIPGDE